MKSQVEEFSLASVLWRAGWSPSGLLSFRKEPLPATLPNLLDHNHTITIDVPGEASLRCGGTILDNFETSHASLAPSSIQHNNNNHNSSATTMMMMNLTVDSDEFFNLYSLMSSPTKSSSSSSSLSASTSKSHFSSSREHSGNTTHQHIKDSNKVASSTSSASQFSLPSPSSIISSPSLSSVLVDQQELFNSSRCRISVQNSGAAPLTVTGWFSSAEENENGENDVMVFRTVIWDSNDNNNNDNNNRRSSNNRVIAKFTTHRTWKETKKIVNLLRELHPEIFLPVLELVDAKDPFVSAQRLEFRLELVRTFISSIQRNSTITTKCPSVVMFLTEEDPEAFSTYLSTMESQHKTQREKREGERLTRIQSRLPAPPEEPGFFTRWFGGSEALQEQQAKAAKEAAAQQKLIMSPEETRAADMRRATSRQLLKDIAATELSTWEVSHRQFYMLDVAAQRMLHCLTEQGNALRDFVDCLAENSHELVGLQCPFSSSSVDDGDNDEYLKELEMESIKRVEENDFHHHHHHHYHGREKHTTTFGTSHNNDNSNNNSFSASAVATKSPLKKKDDDEEGKEEQQQHQENKLSSSSSSSSKAEAPEAILSRMDSVSRVQHETKSLLRLAVMFANCRSDSLLGAQNMISAIALTSRLAMIHAQNVVAYLRHHSNLCERATEYSDFEMDSEPLLDLLIHTARPISFEELAVLQKDLSVKLHTVSVLFYSLSRQLNDSVLRAEATLLAQ